jgi:hypothetical protein
MHQGLAWQLPEIHRFCHSASVRIWHVLCVHWAAMMRFRQADRSKQQEVIMFHVIDHADVVYTGELSQATRYVAEHYGNQIDEAIRSGIRIAYTDPLHGMEETGQEPPESKVPDFWKPFEDWTVD